MRNIPRRKVIGMLAGGFVSFLAAPSTAFAATPSIRNGDACKKVGNKKTQDGKTFECVKRDGVRQWRRIKSEPAKVPAEPTNSGVKVLDSSALALGRSENVKVTSGSSEIHLVLTRTSLGVIALSRRCTHLGELLCHSQEKCGQAEGAQANQLVCPLHGSVFNASTGAVIEGPASRALTQYKATERSGSIYVTI